MKSFPAETKFCFPWRSYQAEVLEELDVHLDDNHLNVVAAPGSGKTVLGLEVMLRLNKPSLILAPSIAIRNQWLTRFLELFLGGVDCPDWISLSVKSPKFLTISTYQGLHAAFSGERELEEDPEEEEEDEENDLDDDEVKVAKVVSDLKGQGLNVIVLDEAHHLRSAWWKSLVKLKEAMVKPQIVSLTATPPYDSNPSEWENYKSMCGPIDAEISVPELVQEKNLCPHQDYVYLNSLSTEEMTVVFKFRSAVRAFIKRLKGDEEFAEALLSHPSLINPEGNVEAILDDPEFYSSIIVYLDAVGRGVPKALCKVLSVRTKFIPSFDAQWAEILMARLLYKDEYFSAEHGELIKKYRKELKIVGAIERRQVYLENNKMVKSLLKGSLNKLNSIVEIVEMEKVNLGGGLRMVILTDFIRRELMPKKAGGETDLTRMGVVPIFEKIRREFRGLKRLGVLSGSLVVLPVGCEQKLRMKALEVGIKDKDLKIRVMAHDKGFFQFDIVSSKRHKIVHLVTELFNEGEVEVLVGTKSLLGEGWDAPTINSLVLASFVGSFMLSNQMRGRAIRTDKADPEKVANIWHLVTVEINQQKAGHDFSTMRRRFKAFVGLSVDDDSIENGIERLDLGLAPYTERDLKKLNKRSGVLSKDRADTGQRWRDVLEAGEVKKLIPEVETEKTSLPRNFVFSSTILALFWRSLLIGAFFFMDTVVGLLEAGGANGEESLAILIGALAISILISLPGMFKALYLFLKHGPISSSIKQVGNAVLKTLCKIDVIKTDVNKLRVVAVKGKGFVRCGLEGGTSYEKAIFLESLEELLDQIENPRYLIVRKTLFGKLNRRDYHPVPKAIAVKKEWAEYFSKMWNKYVGNNHLIYTRNMVGRKALLNARQRSLAARLKKRSKRVSSWR
jgi:superfamily II DNA or RNA helicase